MLLSQDIHKHFNKLSFLYNHVEDPLNFALICSLGLASNEKVIAV